MSLLWWILSGGCQHGIQKPLDFMPISICPSTCFPHDTMPNMAIGASWGRGPGTEVVNNMGVWATISCNLCLWFCPGLILDVPFPSYSASCPTTDTSCLTDHRFQWQVCLHCIQDLMQCPFLLQAPFGVSVLLCHPVHGLEQYS